MVLDAVCDENEVENGQPYSWWSNGVNESGSVVLIDVQGTSMIGLFKATVVAVDSG